ncbi:MAG: MFS transporter [Candidatus Latescibacteria bacterium]|nr:MFS transporter [Candidatus Latescibacterota bacterium]
MANLKNIDVDFDLKRLKVTSEDWEKQDKRTLLLMLQQLYLVRAFETKALELKKQDLIHGPVHSSIGQEAVAVGTMSAIRPTDLIGGTHRAHHQFLAKALAYYTPADYNPLTDQITPEMQQAINTLLAEIMGLSPGCCSGRGGSMHLSDLEIGVLGTDAIVAGGIPIATGAAWAQRYKQSDRLVVSFFGDGAVNQGVFHEALNLAGLWKLPIVYIIENNLYAVATNVKEAFPINNLSLHAVSYGMKGRIVDGMDPLAVKIAMEEAAQDLRKGNAPCLIEAMTYRFFHHGGSMPGSYFGYRETNEEGEWRKKDPAEDFPRKMKQFGFLTQEEDSYLKRDVEETIQKAVNYCTEKSSGTQRIKTILLPNPESLTDGLHSEGKEFSEIKFIEAEDVRLDKQMKYVEAIAEITGHWLEKDPNVFVIGEEVGHFGGGAYQATKGLPQKYPDRIINTPISEAGFSGLALGAAICGLKPVVEIMFPDFVLPAADQIFNHIGKLRYIYGGKLDIPLVMRTRIAIGCGYGGQHSMDPVALFALFSGWRIVAPTTPFDYIGLFNSAMQSKDPVLIVEHHELYNRTGLVPADNYDYYIQMGKAKKLTEGNDVTVLAYSSTVPLATQTAHEIAEEGIGVEVIDLRSLDFASIDYETIGDSLSKTNTLVIVEQAPRSNSIGATIAHECESRFFDYLDSPPARLTGADIPNPVSKVLESAALPSLERTRDIIRSVARREL